MNAHSQNKGYQDGRSDAVSDADMWPDLPGARDLLLNMEDLAQRLNGRDFAYAEGYRKGYREQRLLELAKAYRPHMGQETARTVAQLVLETVSARSPSFPG